MSQLFVCEASFLYPASFLYLAYTDGHERRAAARQKKHSRACRRTNASNAGLLAVRGCDCLQPADVRLGMGEYTLSGSGYVAAKRDGGATDGKGAAPCVMCVTCVTRITETARP